MVGTTHREATESRTPGHDDAGYRHAVAAYLRQVISSGRYPAFGRLAGIILDGRDLDPEESFGLGLQGLLDGVGAQLDSSIDRAAPDDPGR